jgi:isopentenyl-diphosphate delta-isomerase
MNSQSQPDARHVILCDEHGRAQGTSELVAAHTGAGQLHLAFSVYLFSPDGQSLLIQQRSRFKPLWPLVWANTCCSHPRQGETPVEAGQRRLSEEMGISTGLTVGPGFAYRALDPAGRGVEHEYDIILFGSYDGSPAPDPTEVADWKWVRISQLQQAMQLEPEKYAPWLHIGLPKCLLHQHVSSATNARD